MSARLAFLIVAIAVVIVVTVGTLALLDQHRKQEKCQAQGGELYRSLCLLPDGRVRKL